MAKLVRVEVTAYIDENIEDQILAAPQEGVLSIVDGYSIIQAQGVNKLGENMSCYNQKILIAYCTDLSKATAVKDKIMSYAEEGQKIAFLMKSVDIYTFIAGKAL